MSDLIIDNGFTPFPRRPLPAKRRAFLDSGWFERRDGAESLARERETLWPKNR